MKYVSIDLETTGLDPGIHQIVEFAAVQDDLQNPQIPVDELPSIQILIYHPNYIVSPFVTRMHKDIWEMVADINPSELALAIAEYSHLGKYPADKVGEHYVTTMEHLSTIFLDWLGTSDKITVAGKNFATFDKLFLPEAIDKRIRQRVADPGILYLEPGDQVIPNTDECLKRAGISKTTSHRALADARDVCRLLRNKLSGPPIQQTNKS